jgi:hypothetical protein
MQPLYRLPRHRDTGWRSITPDAGVTGRILVRRIGERISIRLESVLPPAGSGSVFLAILPVGFRHVGEHYFLADGRSATLPSQIGMYNGSRVAWMQLMSGSATRPTDALYGEYTWWATETFPAEPYPGTAATPA